jgi:nucleoside-diphosphate-sugar epimerase
MKRILIAGCGDVGSALGVALAAQGHQVYGLRRNVSALPNGIRPVTADLTDPDSMKQLPTVDVVFYTAAASGGTEVAYRNAYVLGVQNVLAALKHAGQAIERVIMIGSTSVYGQNDGSWVDESSPTEPQSFRGEILLEGEQLIKNGPYPGIVARFSGIYGPGRYRMFRAVAGGAQADETGEIQYSNRIHTKDGVRALIHLMSLPNFEDTYLITDGESPPQAEVITFLRNLLVEKGIEIAPDGTTLPRRGGNKRCSNKRLLDSGFVFQYPSHRDGYRQLIDGWQQG